MLSKYGRDWIAAPLNQIARALEGTGVSPNVLTLIGFGLTGVVALVLATGNLFVGGLLLIFAALFDTLDGALARSTDQVTRFGAFLDSTLDRYSEAVTLLGLMIFYSSRPDDAVYVLLLAFTLVGSFMVSYTRARAEAVGIECREGLFQRTERIAVLIVGLLTGWMAPVLWILAIFTNFTALQRVFDVYTKSRSIP